MNVKTLRVPVTLGGYYVRLILVKRISVSEVATQYTYCDRFVGIATVRTGTYDNNLPSDVAAGSSIQCDNLVGTYSTWYRL